MSNKSLSINNIKSNIEQEISGWLDSLRVDNKLDEVISYALNGGKRLRPMLLIVSNVIAGGNIIEAMPYALSLELIHNYSLIHDDMPCMDNDDIRRGQETVHKKYGEWVALLAGDALLNSAYEILFKNLMSSCTKNQIKASNIIANSAGLNGMIYGQLLDLKGDINTISDLNVVNQYKTGKLFEAAIVSGGLLADANELIIEKLKSFAYYFGLAFQIADDIDDYEDININNKTLFSNFAVIEGIDMAKAKKYEYIEKAKNSVCELPNNELLQYFLNKI